MLSSIIHADETAELVVEGQPMVTRVKAPSHMENIDEIRSGWTFRIKETQALQMDDFENPGMIFVDKGLDLWNKVEGSKNKSCASCHSDGSELKGLRTVCQSGMPQQKLFGLWKIM